MTDINLKTLTPDTSLPTTGFLSGADSQASTNPSVYTTQTVATTLLGSTALTGGPALTADAPVLNLTQEWSNGSVAFTGIRYNTTNTNSAAASLLMDLQVGGTSQFKVNRTGIVTYLGTLTAGVAQTVADFSSQAYPKIKAPNVSIYASNSGGAYVYLAPGLMVLSSSDTSAISTILTVKANANLRFGLDDAAAPVAQTLSVQSVVAGTSNTAGANFTINGSQGTGLGAGGTISFQVAPAGSSGTAQNALTTVLRINQSGALSGDATNFGTVYICGDQTGNTASNVALGGPSAEGVTVRNTGSFGFTSANNAIHANADTKLSRAAAGVVQVGTTSSNASGTLKAAVIGTTTAYTVATLPTGFQGARAFVTDATLPTYLGTLTGGGSVVCPVFYNGTAWVSA